jgi:hypothetical protein
MIAGEEGIRPQTDAADRPQAAADPDCESFRSHHDASLAGRDCDHRSWLASRVATLMRSAVVVFKSLKMFGLFERLAMYGRLRPPICPQPMRFRRELCPDTKHDGNMIHAAS